MKTRILLFGVLLGVLVIAACGQANGPGDGAEKDEERETAPVPVRGTRPTRSDVEDVVDTQATLECDRRAIVTAEIEARIEKRLRDVGDRVGEEEGEEGFLLARLEDRELDLAFREAAVRKRDREGRILELELERSRAKGELDQARTSVEEAVSVLARTTSGIVDGTISREEHERATFAKSLAESRLRGAEAALEKTQVALSLGAIAVEEAQIAVERTEEQVRKASMRSPIAGVVTFCAAREGERVRPGDHLYTVEDESTLIAYANVPVRQARRIREGNEVAVGSSAAPDVTRGKVTLVSPTVDKDSGTVRCKVEVVSAEGFKPGLFVNLRIIVERRAAALVVPKRAVLHDDAEGSILFVIEEGKAVRRSVRTGFERGDTIEILEGVTESTIVVIEGQDTLTQGAKVEIRES